MSTITYKYGDLEEAIEYSSEEGKIVLEKNPFLIENKKVQYYTDAYDLLYYPLQLLNVPPTDLTLTAHMVDANKIKVRNKESTSPFSSIDAYVGYYVYYNGNYVLVDNSNKNTLGITINKTIAYTEKDISDIILNVVQKKGKNQPFSYIVLTVSRQLFIDANIEMVQKSTEFLLNIYGVTGTWIYERLEDNGATYDITLVNRAYYLKNITLLSLFNFIVSNDTISLTNLGLTNIPITWTDNEGSFTITFDSRSLIIKLKRNTYSVGGVSQTDYSLTKISNCNPDDLFYFLAKYVAGYTNASDIDIEPGFYYNVPSLSNINDTYIMQDIEDLKNGAKNTITSEPLLTSVSLRLDEFCWDILQSLAYLTNREIIFDDKAYFKPLLPDENSPIQLSIDWGPPATPVSGVTYISTMALAENDDQGSQYLTASQKVVSEAYETTVAISDTTSTYVGQDIKYLAVDDTGGSTVNPNSNRNAQAKIVALNALIKNFKPGDCVEYSINETAVPDNNGNEISSWDDFSTVENTDCFLFKTMLPGTNIVATETYYVKKETLPGLNLWFEYDTDNPLRDAGFNVDTCVASITDAHNNITLTNVPLALKTVEYPACVTTYTWGNPEFMDEQSQFNDLAAVSQDSVLDNTSDTGISSGDATKLVVGNQYVHQLRDDRAGFTGLIMEKNVDNNIYRLVGYNQGTEQAQFNSEGKIVAGANLVTLSDTGITIGTSPTDSPTSISLSKESTIQIVDETTTPAVSINADGSSFKGDVVFDKTITVDDGIILGEHGSMLSGGTLNITVSDVGQTYSSPIVISSPAQGESIAGTYLNHRYTTSLHDLDSTIDYQDVGGTPTFSKVIWEGSEPTAMTIKNVLTGASSSYIEFSYESAKNPENWPSMLLENMNLLVSFPLKTQPNVSTSPYTIPSITTISLPIRFYRSTLGELNESVQVTIGYKMSNYSYGGSGSPTITPINTIYYTSSEISLNSQWSGSDQYKDTYVDVTLTNSFNQSSANALYGKFVSSIESIQLVVKLPLSRKIGFSSLKVGTQGMSTAGNMFVSKYGVWGSTTVWDATANTLKANSISPMVNVNYLEGYVNGLLTPYNVLGLKRIIALPEGQSPPSGTTFQSGDIILYYQ